MKKIKVVSIYTGKNKQLNEVLPNGFETQLELIESDKKGNICYNFVGFNGETYSDSYITACVGYKNIITIFEKI